MGIPFPKLRRHLSQVVQLVHQGAAIGMGEAAAGKELPAARLAAPVAQGWIGAEQGHLQPHRQLLLELRHHVAGDKTLARAQLFGDAGQQGGALQQLGGEGPRRAVVGVEELEAAAGVGGGHARQELQHRIHHQIGQQLAGDVNHAHPRIPQANQGKELALFVVHRPGDQVELGRIHREGGHHEQIDIQGAAAMLLAPGRLELTLQVLKAQGHGERGASRSSMA